MKIFINILLLTFSALSFCSCDQSDIIEVPEYPKKLVTFVVGVSNNHDLRLGRFDRGWSSEVGLSMGVLDTYCWSEGSEISPILSISDDSDQFLVHAEEMFFEICSYRYYENFSSFPEGGNTYHLEIEDENFGELYSEYTHPDIVPFEIISMEYMGKGIYEYDDLILDQNYSESGHYYKLAIEIDDPDQPNFYGINLSYTMSNQMGSSSIFVAFNFIDPQYDYSKYLFGSNYGRDLKDEFFNGEKYKLLIKIFVSDFSFQGMNDYEPDEVKKLNVVLRNYSPELYRYYEETYLQSLSEQDPNGAPMPVQTNINGGFGVFGGYAENLQSIEVDLVDLAEGD